MPDSIRSVQVRQFRSSVTEYGLEQEITGLVTEAIVRDGRLAIQNEDPDARIEGSVVYFDRTAVSYTGSEEVEQYRLELRVTVSMDRTADNEYIIRNETISEWILYDPSSESFDSARERVVSQVSTQIVRRCLRAGDILIGRRAYSYYEQQDRLSHVGGSFLFRSPLGLEAHGFLHPGAAGEEGHHEIVTRWAAYRTPRRNRWNSFPGGGSTGDPPTDPSTRRVSAEIHS